MLCVCDYLSPATQAGVWDALSVGRAVTLMLITVGAAVSFWMAHPGRPPKPPQYRIHRNQIRYSTVQYQYYRGHHSLTYIFIFVSHIDLSHLADSSCSWINNCASGCRLAHMCRCTDANGRSVFSILYWAEKAEPTEGGGAEQTGTDEWQKATPHCHQPRPRYVSVYGLFIFVFK